MHREAESFRCPESFSKVFVMSITKCYAKKSRKFFEILKIFRFFLTNFSRLAISVLVALLGIKSRSELLPLGKIPS